jgi:hypothetical protein
VEDPRRGRPDDARELRRLLPRGANAAAGSSRRCASATSASLSTIRVRSSTMTRPRRSSSASSSTSRTPWSLPGSPGRRAGSARPPARLSGPRRRALPPAPTRQLGPRDEAARAAAAAPTLLRPVCRFFVGEPPLDPLEPLEEIGERGEGEAPRGLAEKQRAHLLAEALVGRAGFVRPPTRAACSRGAAGAVPRRRTRRREARRRPRSADAPTSGARARSPAA